MNHELIIATCQFPVSGDIKRNASYILRQMAEAKQKGADVSHFPESSLSGYAGTDFKRYKSQDEALRLGSLEKIIKRYDKRFCTGKEGELEHAYYKPGQKGVQFKIKGFTCGVLICHEWRYPELYREQKQRGTQILFQSWYDGNLGAKEYNAQGKELGSLITGAVRANAANNYLWISASNTSARESCFASFVARPDGKMLHQLKRNVTGIVISKIDAKIQYADPSAPWRKRAYKGILHSGRL